MRANPPEKQRADMQERAGMGREEREPADEIGLEPFRLKTARDLLALLEEQVQAVRSDPEAGPLEKARTIGHLAGIALKAMEVADLAPRVEALEAILKRRNVG